VSADQTTSDAIPFDVEPTPEPPKTRSWKVVLWLLATVFVLCLAGSGGAYWAITRGAQALQDPPRRATAAFLNDLKVGRYNDAYLSLCDTAMKLFSRDAFVTQMQNDPKVASYVIREVSVRTVDNVDTAIVTVDITRAAGAVERHSIQLTSQEGTWLICGQPF
jgi:hypothetical protein